MGARANIKITDNYDKNGVYLYTHWAAAELPSILQTASKRGKDRWDDPQYLSRIVFCEMLKAHVGSDRNFQEILNATTGLGISGKVGDGGDRILAVDCSKKTVRRISEDSDFKKEPETEWTLEDFCNLGEKQLDCVWY